MLTDAGAGFIVSVIVMFSFTGYLRERAWVRFSK